MKTIQWLCFTVALLSLDLALGQVDRKAKAETEWETWKGRYGKKYSSVSEEAKGRAVWERNTAFIQKHNSMMDRTFDVAMNEFGDQEKLTRKHSPFSRRLSPTLDKSDRSQSDVTIPGIVDWRKKGVVTAVRNQGMMGSSVADAAADAVASYHAIHTANLAELSAQEVEDCCQSHFADIFDCIHNLGGLCKAGSYKTSNGTCDSRSCVSFAQVPRGGQHVTPGNESALAQAVAIEPVMVTIDASQTSFQLYNSGVYFSNSCSSTKLDHSMLVVGYWTGVMDFWICKNSWGASWGVNGYIMMARNKDNMCGIATDASYPV